MKRIETSREKGSAELRARARAAVVLSKRDRTGGISAYGGGHGTKRRAI